MPNQSDEEFYEQLKSLASKYKIEILTAKAQEYRSDIKENDSVVSMHTNNLADNIISISKKPMYYKNYSFSVLKSRDNCPITEFIKKNNKEGLKNYLDELAKQIPSIVDVITYKNKFQNNFYYILKNKKDAQEFLDILENSQLFQHCKVEIDFWITVAFKADNLDFLYKKLNLNEIMEYPKLQDKLRVFSPINIVEDLLKYNEFKEKLEREFNLLNFIPIMMDSPLLKFLELVLEHIKVNQNLDFEELCKNFDKMNSLDNEENNKYYFNEAMKVFILNAQYDFTEKDKELEVFTDENKQLIVKKTLHKNLHKKLTPKIPIKKSKI